MRILCFGRAGEGVREGVCSWELLATLLEVVIISGDSHPRSVARSLGRPIGGRGRRSTSNHRRSDRRRSAGRRRRRTGRRRTWTGWLSQSIQDYSTLENVTKIDQNVIKSEHIILKKDRSRHPVIRDQVKERDMDRGNGGGGGVEAVNSSHGKHRNQLSLAPLSICLLAILRWTTTSGGPDYFLRKIY